MRRTDHDRHMMAVFCPRAKDCGSGTTPRAAKDLGRRFIGIEINPEYCVMAERRIAQEAMAI
jgi:hypothetical protein